MLSWPVLTAFALIFALACASPGPAVAAVLARVLARGSSGMVWFVLGLMLGDILWLSAAVFGLAARRLVPAALSRSEISRRRLPALSRLETMACARDRGVGGAGARAGRETVGRRLLLAMGNPKTMLFYLALLPTLIDLPTAIGFSKSHHRGRDLRVVFAGYVLLAAQARRAFTSPRAVRIVNRTSGVAMAGRPRRRRAAIVQGRTSSVGMIPAARRCSNNSASGTASRKTIASANVISTRGGKDGQRLLVAPERRLGKEARHRPHIIRIAFAVQVEQQLFLLQRQRHRTRQRPARRRSSRARRCRSARPRRRRRSWKRNRAGCG